MKSEKMSIEKMKNVLTKVLSREEMKQVMAGSGGGNQCGGCSDELHAISYACYTVQAMGGSYCACGGVSGGAAC